MSNTSKTFPRDVFLYLLAIISMVTVAVSFGILVYQYIDIQNPDVLTESYYWSKSAAFNSIRNSMAVLIVVFPVFVWASWFLRKDVSKNPEKREMKIRRWLLYLTLFAASLVIIGDLVALLMNFLNGELTTRFALKVLTVFSIAGSVFIHYFSELRDKPFLWMTLFDKLIIIVVAVGVVAGFWIAGSPAHQREVRLDEQRITDLSIIQYQVIDYWQRKQELPVNLLGLTNDISGFVPPKDPETRQDYGYRITTPPYSFEVCAMFTTSNSEEFNGKITSESVHYGGEPTNWAHGKGMTCFERTIDPDYYPPIKGGVMPIPQRM